MDWCNQSCKYDGEMDYGQTQIGGYDGLGRVAQIVAAWQRRCEKVEEERENGRKWRERERDASALFCSVLFCRKMLMVDSKKTERC